MISTILWINWLLLKRDRVALIVALVVPIFFFSIFALIFGGQDQDRTTEVKVVLVDEAHNATSRRLIEALEKDLALVLQRESDKGVLLDRAAAQEMVASGRISTALVIPKGFRLAGTTPAAGPGATEEPPPIILFSDASDPVAPKMAAGLLQAAYSKAKPDAPPAPSANAADKDSAAIPLQMVDVVGQGGKNPAIAFYAASTGVMFLLFTISASAGTLLDEEQIGVLERLLTSDLGMGRLLFGKWLYLSLQGIAQVSLMFVWGSLVFGLDLWSANHLLGFVIMTTFTAVAASAFGLALASACRTRAQLGGITVILVLTMSVVGGSMFPRFLMPDWMQSVGLITFNAWALDGYQKIFWYDLPLVDLWPQLAVLAGVTIVCMALARWWARRWEVI